MTRTPITYDDVQSPFIADRIRETSWHQRQYITDLLQIARYIERNGPRSFAEALAYKQLKSSYPAEFQALELEHSEERGVSTEEFLHIKEDIHREQIVEEARQLLADTHARRQQRRLEKISFASWRKAGGRA